MAKKQDIGLVGRCQKVAFCVMSNNRGIVLHPFVDHYMYLLETLDNIAGDADGTHINPGLRSSQTR
jgi:hypothetical protein